MATRIHQDIVRGEIDNRVPGRVSGRIWLLGYDKPISLELSGNCRRDLAGCVVTFVNTKVVPAGDEPIRLESRQNGVAGDITASRKVRVFDMPLEEALRLTREGGTPPEHMANALYIEWFSEANGRVVIESADYTVAVTSPEWALSPAEEEEQVETSHQAMRDWLDRLDQSGKFEDPAAYQAEEEKPLDEFGYEKFMRESDARTDQYMELLEKYEGHPDQEKIVAREMGWEWLEEALEADERGALPLPEEMELPPLVPNPATEGVDWVRDKNDHIHHPLTKRASESAMSIWHFCDELNLLEEGGDTDLQDMIFEFQTTGAKIAGALDSLAYDDDEDSREGGFVVAALKRALAYLHRSIAASEKVAGKNILPPDRLERFRADLFSVREEMLSLMQRFRTRNR